MAYKHFFKDIQQEALEIAGYEPELTFELLAVVLRVADEIYADLIEEALLPRHRMRQALRFQPSLLLAI